MRFEDYLYEETLKSLNRENKYRLAEERRRRTREERKRRTKYELTLLLVVIVWAILCVVVLFGKLPEADVQDEYMEPASAITIVDTREEAMEDPTVMYLNCDTPAEEPEPPYLREDIPLDAETQALLYEACGETGIDYELALAVVRKETTYRNVVGDSGESYGYMQVQPRWHTERMDRLGVTDLMDPLSNFRVGCDYLAELLDKYELTEALTCYNTGKPGHTEYADIVIGYWEELKTSE